MATDTMSTPSNGNASMAETQDNLPEFVQVAEATGTPAPQTPGQPPAIPGVPNGEVHVAFTPDQTVVRVQVAPGETIDLPFDGTLAAKFGEQGNLAVKVGDQTIILLGYAEANQQAGVTLHDSHGQPIDVATVVAQTDPNLDIQTAAGPAAGPAGGQGGHLFFGFAGGNGLGGFGELGVINPTDLQYKLIQPDESIHRFLAAVTPDHTLSVTATPGSVDTTTEDYILNNKPSGSKDIGNYLLNTSVEGQNIGNAGWVVGVNPANVTMNGSADTTVTFERENAANHNMVGVYAFDADGNVIPGSLQFVWLDATQVSGSENKLGGALINDFLGNAQNLTVDLGTLPAGEKLGFFLVQNGALDASDVAAIKAAAASGGGYDMSKLNSSLSIVFDAQGVGHIKVGDTVLESNVLFTSNTTWNADGQQHATSGVNPNTGLHDNNLYIGFEDKTTKSDHDFNDVIFGVNLGSQENALHDVKSSNPQIVLGDSAGDINKIVITTSGFLVNDELNHLASASGFDVVYSKNGNDYTVTITETTNHTTTQWQDFVNTIGFDTTSKVDGTRSISYDVTDGSGHSGHADTSVTVTSHYTESLSVTDTIHHGAVAGSNVTWGSGDDTLYFDQNFATSGTKDGILDMGGGNDTLKFAVNGQNFNGFFDSQHLRNVEHFDMTGFGNNTTTLKASQILDMNGDGSTLRFDGDSKDTVKLTGDGGGAGHWTALADTSIGGTNYHQYEWTAANGHTAVVQINEHLQQTVTD